MHSKYSGNAPYKGYNPYSHGWHDLSGEKETSSSEETNLEGPESPKGLAVEVHSSESRRYIATAPQSVGKAWYGRSQTYEDWENLRPSRV